jgi:hypothetical protein
MLTLLIINYILSLLLILGLSWILNNPDNEKVQNNITSLEFLNIEISYPIIVLINLIPFVTIILLCCVTINKKL